MGVDTTTFAYALKQRYPSWKLQNLVYQDNPFLAMVPKVEDFTGSSYEVPVRYADTQGRSATFATAQTNKGNHKGVRFGLTRVKDYALATITTEVIRASKMNPGAFLPAAEAEMESAANALNRSMGQALYRSGTGSIGQRGSVASSTLTLLATNDIVNFEVGDIITASATDGGALRTGSITVATVDRDAGSLTFTGTITALADGDFLMKQGDEAAGGANKRFAGLLAWLPPTAPSATTFFGVDRSVDAVRLGGIRKDISSKPMVEGLVEVANRINREGGRATHCFIDYEHFTSLVHELGAKVNYVEKEVGTLGFRGARITAGKQDIEVYPDQNCPSAYGFMLQLDSWKLATLGVAPDYLDEDGLKMLRESSSDGYEVRMGLYGNLGCNAPGYNAVMTMP